MVSLPRACVSTSILEKRPGKAEFLGKPLIQSNSQQFVWLEGLLTVSRFKKSLMNAPQLTMTYIETVDSLRDSCCWEKHRRTKPLAKILIWLSAAKQRLRVKEESYWAYIEEELSLRKRRKEIHQARPWRHWAAGEWCWYWRSGKHKGSRMKGGVFLGPARVLIQERETTAEGVRMKGVVWITEGTSLVRCAAQILRSLSESENRLCSIADTESISFQDRVGRLPHSTFLDLTTQTDVPDDAWEDEITGWNPRSTRDPSSSSSFWRQSDATSRLGPDLMPPSRSMRTDDEMSAQEPETTHASVAHPSASETIPSDVPVASVEPEDSVQTTSTRRILFKRPPNPLDRMEPPKRTGGDEDDHSAFSAYHHDLEKVSENLKNGNGVFSGTGMPDMLDSAWLAIKNSS